MGSKGRMRKDERQRKVEKMEIVDVLGPSDVLTRLQVDSREVLFLQVETGLSILGILGEFERFQAANGHKAWTSGKKRILTWEDGYLDNAKGSVPVENALHDGLPSVKPGIISFGYDKDAWIGSSAGCPIEMVVASMSCQLYSLGEGIIGKVAETGDHRWIFAGEFDSKSPSECSGKWELQFKAGIKTILLVPVRPHGLVQLGSLDMVTEDSTLVVHIKDLFSTLYHISGTCSSLAPRVDCVNPLSSFGMPLLGNLSAPSVLNSDLFNPIQMQQLPTVSPHMLQYNFPTSQDVMDHIFDMSTRPCKYDNVRNARYSNLWMDPAEEPCLLNGSTDLDKILEGDIPFIDDEMNSTSHPTDVNHSLTSEQIALSNAFVKDAEHDDYDLCKLSVVTNQEFGKEHADINGRFVNFPLDLELHKILGLHFSNEHDDHVMAAAPKADELRSSTAICQAAGPEYNGSLIEESNAWFAKESDADYLLDALLANLQHPNDNSLETFRCMKSCSNSSEECMDSCLTHCRNEQCVFNLRDSSPSNHELLAFVSENEGSASTPTDSPSKSIGMLINKKQNSCLAWDKNDRDPKSSQTNKRRRSNKLHKPRPRDRQLIQDRVKELRELIPDGSKCSIDALLDRTVKHMLFLKSVSSQAEKLRMSTVPKVAGEDWNSEISQTQQNGASWACQLRCQSEICPLKVENLDKPGQILIEMLCEEYGLFLEIAQVIRRLELIILKGVLESRSDKLWAHFIIEVWYNNVPHTRLVEDKGGQNWISRDKDKFKFPGGGTQFIHGANQYLDQISKMVPNIAFGTHTRVALDVGCGVASFGAFLLSRNVTTLSIAPKDVHENQIQFALERGVPAMIAAFATRWLLYPNQAFDLIHCSRCRINWTRDDGILLLEVNRMLRAGGYFIWAAQPVYKHEESQQEAWKDASFWL
ncbi:putative transcription factor bHLH155 [Cocos nucifera]|uniref:Putative transcription factor bHLH155 n=1 Tax=Cocos nucifera TaxID=13894 RepID=A0A8K0I752_COCNU|nr:putative transcription factor bHLH155 [Cocos nucifera]